MKKILTAIFIMSALIVSAQNDTLKVKNHLFKANLLLTPSLDYEKGITENSTLGFQLGTELLTATNDVTDETKLSGLYLTLEAYYRYYYNFKRRIEKGKNISNNSANYFGISTMYIHADPIIKDNIEISDDYLLVPIAIWGFQRPDSARILSGAVKAY